MGMPVSFFWKPLTDYHFGDIVAVERGIKNDDPRIPRNISG